MAEEWFGNVIVTNLGIAAALVQFYGCQHMAVTSLCTDIDLHHDRERWTSDAIDSDVSLHREGLREYIAIHVVQC